MIESVWDSASKVLLKGFWGWSPEAWGTLSFANPGRRQTIMRQSTDPFIAVACVPMGVSDKSVAGKMPGFYLVSHQMGHRDEFTDAVQRSQNIGRWEYGLRAIAAFTFLPEYRIETYDLNPAISARIRATAASGEWLDSDKIERLKTIPYVQVPVFGGPACPSPQLDTAT